MGYVCKAMKLKRTTEEYINVFFHILDQGFPGTGAHDRGIFNLIRTGVLEEEYTPSQKRRVQKSPTLKDATEQIRARCREDHIIRLKTKAYLRRSREGNVKRLAGLYTDYMCGENVVEKYGLSLTTIASYVSQIRHSAKYEDVRKLLVSNGIDLSSKTRVRTSCKKTKEAAVSLQNDLKDNIEKPKTMLIREALINFAVTNEAVELFSQNLQLRDAFYNLVHALTCA